MSGHKARNNAMSLDLFGHQLTVRSDNDAETVREIVAFVNKRLNAVQGSSRRAPSDKIALLCALNIAEELFAERRAHEALKARVAADSRRLLGVVDRLAQVEAKGSET